MKIFLLIVILFTVNFVFASDVSKLETLFTTYSERETLDRLRDHYQGEIKIINESHDAVVMRGYIVRGNGESTVWVNNSNTLKPLAPEEGLVINTDLSGKESITVIMQGQMVNLKPGQVYEKSSGNVVESYLRQKVPVKPDALDLNVE